MEVRIALDDEDEILVRYLAEVEGTSVEESIKNAVMDKIRQMYESQAANGSRSSSKYSVEDDTPDDDYSN